MIELRMIKQNWDSFKAEVYVSGDRRFFTFHGDAKRCYDKAVEWAQARNLDVDRFNISAESKKMIQKNRGRTRRHVRF